MATLFYQINLWLRVPPLSLAQNGRPLQPTLLHYNDAWYVVILTPSHIFETSQELSGTFVRIDTLLNLGLDGEVAEM